MSKLVLKFLDVNLSSNLNIFQYVRRVFSGDKKDVEVPAGFTLQLHSPEIDGELTVDGEVFIE